MHTLHHPYQDCSKSTFLAVLTDEVSWRLGSYITRWTKNTPQKEYAENYLRILLKGKEVKTILAFTNSIIRVDIEDEEKIN